MRLCGNTTFKIDTEESPDDSSLNEVVQPMYLQTVKEHIRRSITRELPFNVPFRAKVFLIEQAWSDWSHYCQNCFDLVYKATSEEFQTLVKKHFGRFNATALLDHIQAIVDQQIDLSREKTQERIEWLLELENPPFTLNEHYFSSLRDKYLSEYRDARRTSNVIEGPGASAAISALANIGFHGLKIEDLGRLNGPDPYEEELVVMAEISAYFYVSYKRIIDNIPRVIDHDFLRSIGNDIQGALIQGLSLGENDATQRAASYIAEDEQTKSRREGLLRKKERLDEVQKKLFNFGA